MNKIAIIGFGRIGSILGAYLSKHNNNLVYGIDIDHNFLETFKSKKTIFKETGLYNEISRSLKKKRLILTDNLKHIKKCKYIIICVGTPLANNLNSINTLYLKNCLRKIKNFLNNKKTVILKSSVTPGTCFSIFKKTYKKKKFKFAYCPERLAEGTALKDLKKNSVLIGAYDKKSLEITKKFWETNKLKTFKLNSVEEAEITKLATNSWIDVNIAFANEIAKIIDNLKFDIDVINVIKAANNLKKGSSYVNMLLPSIGVGGSCLTKDPIFLDREKSKKEKYSLISEARKINDNMPIYCVNRILKFLKEKKMKVKSKKVLILGATFKGNTDDVKYTPVFSFVKELKKYKFKNIEIFDKKIKLKDRILFNCNFSNDLETSLKNSDILVIAADHNYIKKTTPLIIEKFFSKKGLIFDGRRYFDHTEKFRLKNKNFNFAGIGRS